MGHLFFFPRCIFSCLKTFCKVHGSFKTNFLFTHYFWPSIYCELRPAWLGSATKLIRLHIFCCCCNIMYNCTTFHYITPNLTALRYIQLLQYIALHWTALHNTALNCTALQYTSLWPSPELPSRPPPRPHRDQCGWSTVCKIRFLVFSVQCAVRGV